MSAVGEFVHNNVQILGSIKFNISLKKKQKYEFVIYHREKKMLTKVLKSFNKVHRHWFGPV